MLTVKVHPSALPMFDVHKTQIGWKLKTHDFDFHALAQEDGTIKTYIEWGDEQEADIATYSSWEEIKHDLDLLCSGISPMTGLQDDMDRYERRALELETEQRHRFDASGSHRDFWDSRYEEMQLFMIRRYRDLSTTWSELRFSSQGLQPL